MKRFLLIGGIFFAFIALLVLWAVFPVLSDKTAVASTKILARDGTLLYEIPRAQDGLRTPVASIPSNLKSAVMAAEDARFGQHHGVDWRAIGRSVYDRLRGKQTTSGASTIEQQLVKNLYFSSAPRSVFQKIREVLCARYWSLTHKKDETLLRYLNTIPFGNRTFGVQSASERYFHKSASDLSLPESAFLAGLIQAPSAYDPYARWSAAKDREAYVLDQMEKRGFISSQDHQDALKAEIVLFPSHDELTAPHFVFRVINELEKYYPDLRSGGYTVTTTLDPELQRAAEDAITRSLSKFTDEHVTDAAALAVDVKTGEVLAYVGSADYWNDAIQGKVDVVAAKRQPGSALKPFLYFLAFLRGMAPATVIADLPVRYETADGHSYYPRNYGYGYRGPVPIRDALGSSLNVPAVKVLHEIGLPMFFGTLASFGLTFPEPADHYGLGIVLGGGEVTLWDATNAYASLARYGKSLPLVDVQSVSVIARNEAISDSEIATSSQTPPRNDRSPKPLFDDQTKAAQSAVLIANILSDQAARSRSFGEESLMDLGKNVAVKTGTTKDFRDNWAFGYTTDFAMGVWVGNADNSPMKGVTGISGAVPIWRAIMIAQEKGNKPADWPRPDGLVERNVCVTSGLLANDLCPKTRNELFISGTEPTKTDDWYVRCGQKIYLNPPAEYAAWRAAAGMEIPSDPSCLASQSAASSLQIIAPLDNDTYELDDMINQGAQQIPFIAGGSIQPPYAWTLNSQTLVSSSPTLLWQPAPGSYTLTLEHASGSVRFTVK